MTRAARWNLWLLVLVSAAPVLGGWFFILNPEHLPDARANRGELIDPVVPVGDTRLAGLDGPFTLSEFRGQWVLLLHARECGDACLAALWGLRQVRLALGEGRERVGRVLLLEGEAAGGLPDRLVRDVVLATPLPEGGALSQSTAADGAVYVVDPFGNLVMRHPPPVQAEALLHDMEHLLRVSEQWGKHE